MTISTCVTKGCGWSIDETKKTMKISREMSYSEIADLSILKEAQREMRKASDDTLAGC